MMSAYGQYARHAVTHGCLLWERVSHVKESVANVDGVVVGEDAADLALLVFVVEDRGLASFNGEDHHVGLCSQVNGV